MLTIKLTDLPARTCRRETFRDGTVLVLSRSGVHPTERALIEALPAVATAGPILVAGNRTGALGLILAAEHPGVPVVQHALDMHHLRALERTFATNPCPAMRAVCSADLADLPAPSLAVLQITARDTPAELVLDQIEDLHALLPDGAACLIAYDGKSDWLRRQLLEVFGQIRAIPDDDVTLYHGVKRRPQPERRDFSAPFPASLPGDAPLVLTTRPGVFAHRRADEGGVALAEVAARDLQPGARVLDLGCGCGLVGILLARHAAVKDVLAVDANARAVACTAANATANGVTCLRTLLTDTGTTETGFTLAVGNPPYFSDFKIAELFIETARSALVRGGLALMVAKSHRQLAERMQAAFGNAEVIARRGYGVIKSVKS